MKESKNNTITVNCFEKAVLDKLEEINCRLARLEMEKNLTFPNYPVYPNYPNYPSYPGPFWYSNKPTICKGISTSNDVKVGEIDYIGETWPFPDK